MNLYYTTTLRELGAPDLDGFELSVHDDLEICRAVYHDRDTHYNDASGADECEEAVKIYATLDDNQISNWRAVVDLGDGRFVFHCWEADMMTVATPLELAQDDADDAAHAAAYERELAS